MPARKPVIYIGTDHAAREMKDTLVAYLAHLGYKVVDMGAYEDDPTDDYPDFVLPAAEAVAASKGRAKGIVLGGSGIGECIAANKVKGIRAALVYDTFTARATREHNDSNVICLGSRGATRDIAVAKRLLKKWLDTPFTKEPRHVRRLKKIADYEKTGRMKRHAHPSPEGDCIHE